MKMGGSAYYRRILHEDIGESLFVSLNLLVSLPLGLDDGVHSLCCLPGMFVGVFRKSDNL